jgi:molecular chaperone DnaK
MWSIDLGTTNTGLCRWDSVAEKARLIELVGICRDPKEDDPMQAPRLVPSSTHVLPGNDVWTQLGRLPGVSDMVFWGQQAEIGRPALERNQTKVYPEFALTFKPYLGMDSQRNIARVGKQHVTAREVARMFLRELLAQVKRQTGERIREIVVTTPVESFEAYRAEVRYLFRKLGVRKVHFVDEPVAAAVGYGVTASQMRRVLVVDFGGGTLDLALVAIEPKTVKEGSCVVVAKAGRSVGGNLVDEWLLEDFCERLAYRIPEGEEFWRRLMVDEARRVKEELFFREHTEFLLTPPEEMRAYHARVHGEQALQLTRQDLVSVLTKNGLYRMLREVTEDVLERAGRSDVNPDQIDDVLMVGGSTLLPGVFAHFEEAFGRDRVRAWQPFEAVARGACTLKAAGFEPSDYIVHDYGFVTHDRETNEKQYQIIVPAGTRFPTPPDFWRRQLVPTCALGEPEKIFKLVVCEIGKAHKGERHFAWDRGGQLHSLKDTGDRLVVPLNEDNPTMGYLEPPHPPSDKAPRLDVKFGINENRWLVATVDDLKTGKPLMKTRPVIRLL